MNPISAPSIEAYWSILEQSLPTFSPEEQRAAVTLYRELAGGEPVSVDRLSLALRTPVERTHRLLAKPPLSSFVYADENGLIQGFGGLAVAPMHHRFRVESRELWTWCAWDGLFIPEILGSPAIIESQDPETGSIVRLAVSLSALEKADSEDAVVSFVLPESDGFQGESVNVMAKFCHFIFLFESRDSGERWTRRHSGTFLYSLEDAFQLGRWLNARNFGDELRRRRL